MFEISGATINTIFHEPKKKKETVKRPPKKGQNNYFLNYFQQNETD